MALYSEHPRFITTFDDTWLVAIPHPTESHYIHKTFRPQSERQLREAQAWRDQAYKSLYGHPVPQRTFHKKPKDTATQLPGVRFVIKRVKKKGTERVYEIPTIIAEVHTIPGCNYQRPRGSKSKLFSLNKFDWDEAVALARAWREKQVQALAFSRELSKDIQS